MHSVPFRSLYFLSLFFLCLDLSHAHTHTSLSLFSPVTDDYAVDSLHGFGSRDEVELGSDDQSYWGEIQKQMIEIEIIRIREIRTEMGIKSYLLDNKSIDDDMQNDDDIDGIILLLYFNQNENK